MENVTYSTAEYTVTVTVSLDEAANTLKADVKVNGASDAVAEFENTYDYTPASENPATSDDSKMALWIVMMFLCGGAALTLCAKKRRA